MLMKCASETGPSRVAPQTITPCIGSEKNAADAATPTGPHRKPTARDNTDRSCPTRPQRSISRVRPWLTNSHDAAAPVGASKLAAANHLTMAEAVTHSLPYSTSTAYSGIKARQTRPG